MPEFDINLQKKLAEKTYVYLLRIITQYIGFDVDLNDVKRDLTTVSLLLSVLFANRLNIIKGKALKKSYMDIKEILSECVQTIESLLGITFSSTDIAKINIQNEIVPCYLIKYENENLTLGDMHDLYMYTKKDNKNIRISFSINSRGIKDKFASLIKNIIRAKEKVPTLIARQNGYMFQTGFQINNQEYVSGQGYVPIEITLNSKLTIESQMLLIADYLNNHQTEELDVSSDNGDISSLMCFGSEFLSAGARFMNIIEGLTLQNDVNILIKMLNYLIADRTGFILKRPLTSEEKVKLAEKAKEECNVLIEQMQILENVEVMIRDKYLPKIEEYKAVLDGVQSLYDYNGETRPRRSGAAYFYAKYDTFRVNILVHHQKIEIIKQMIELIARVYSLLETYLTASNESKVLQESLNNLMVLRDNVVRLKSSEYTIDDSEQSLLIREQNTSNQGKSIRPLSGNVEFN